MTRPKHIMKLDLSNDALIPDHPSPLHKSSFSDLSKFMHDPSYIAVLHPSGVDFTSGSSYTIQYSELILGPDLGSGNYGVVKKVLHRPSKTSMAMKEIRLELDEKHLNQILMELDVLHRARSPYIVDFYGAFFIETCVYYCMEFMDAGSLDKLYGKNRVPENVLSRIADAVVHGLKFLKEELSIMHRDVKPTNILVNTKGEVKLCDFGVSGQLIQSLAKTHIGCQSYMAPERIMAETSTPYSTASDVWSLGLSLLECALGHYPYAADTVFAQLSQIIHGAIPAMPTDCSPHCQDFIHMCLQVDPSARPTFPLLLHHEWLVEWRSREVDLVGWVRQAMQDNSITQS